MSILEQQEPQLPGQVNGWVAALAFVALALMMGGAYLMRGGKTVTTPAPAAAAAAAPGTFQTACWSLLHPDRLKKADKLGLEMEIQVQAFVACVVTDTRTGEVVKSFVPPIPGQR